ncbi:hypothetical protein D1627_13715 [Pontibacter oryzae]|uniref:Uncharacterized protein n=2 Tax=Pontibacter oryzae TaxID=2304593 RepID=A0A399RY36_9BACT|nr:hypothetical protein D1627_13715 [Pontibacter oryzae]
MIMIASVVSGLVFILLVSLFPHKQRSVKNYDALLQLNQYKYNIYEIFSIIPLFFFVGLICYITYLLGNDVQNLIFSGRTVDIAIYPPDTFWLASGLCFGFGLIVPPMELLYRILLGEEYDIYTEYTNRKHGYDGFRVLRPICLAFVVVGLAVSVLGLGWYKEITADRILINDFFSLRPQTYTVSDVRSLTRYEKSINADGFEKPDLHYKIVFTDGRVWDTSDNFHEVSPEVYGQVIQHILSRSSLTLQHQETDR